MSARESYVWPINVSENRSILFGPFTLIPHQRLLLEGDKPLHLTSRALEILIALVERPGELVSKQELMKLVWPDTTVVEANLTVHVSTLRRTLGDGQGGNRYIVNIPGRGYRFVAPITHEALSPGLAPPEAKAKHNLPTQITRLVGRAAIIEDLVRHRPENRLITLVGTGGIGKTVLALRLAEELVDSYQDGVWFVDLSAITEPRLAATALGSALNLELRSTDPITALIAALVDRKVLFVLDNCEHVIDEIGDLVACILRGTPQVSFLATSREPLNVQGERVHRLLPLDFPAPSKAISAEEALGYPAVQLFVERAMAAISDYELTDVDAPYVAEICRRLEGVPLAIEFAAARVPTFGISGVAERLDDRLRLLKATRRGSPNRHHTIAATLDWSYQLLNQQEQAVLRRLAVFSGGCTLDAAIEIAADSGEKKTETADIVAGLITKSLVNAEIGQGEMRIRLLETIRAYVLEKLAATDELQSVSRRHAVYFRNLMEPASLGPLFAVPDDFDQKYAVEIGNIRAALAWAFDFPNEVGLAVDLAATSVWIWQEMLLLAECRKWTAKALDLLSRGYKEPRRELTLQYGFGFSTMFSEGISDEASAALVRAEEIAAQLGVPSRRLAIVATLVTDRHRREDFRGALLLARQAEVIASELGERAALRIADFALGAALFFLGDYRKALPYLQRAHGTIVVPPTRKGRASYASGNRCLLPHALWLLGSVKESKRAAAETLSNAELEHSPLLVCRALVWSGCNLAIEVGDFTCAERSIGRLKTIAKEYSLSIYYPCAVAFEGELAAKRGDLTRGARLLQEGLDGLRSSRGSTQLYTPFLSKMAEVLMKTGAVDEAHRLADEAVMRIEHSNGLWWLPEALRIRGEIGIAVHGPSDPAAEGIFRGSLELAREQGALSWELRTAISAAALYEAQERRDDARNVLRRAYDQFDNGFDTTDVVRARIMLENLNG